MFLTSLKLRGFKSFADTTTLEIEPGVTVIVGPNGSGKSNVVDALSWVLGTAAPSKVRGGTMTDVVFAGSPNRRPASMARVEITIDNSAGVLGHSAVGTSRSAQGFAEVTVSREIAADGTGTYSINGEVVRALDVQELLSDTGLGRELHTIVGQGQLDEILNARPEERRRYVEEAAGILKHRRRRERSVRKLEQVDDHLHQLSLVLRELRRQLRPLQRQAEQADRHKVLQADLRAVRLQLAAHDLSDLTAKRASQADTDQATADREASARNQVETLRAGVVDSEATLSSLAPQADQARDLSHRLTTLKERLRGTTDLVDARRRHLADHIEEPLAGRPPVELRAAADRAQAARDDRESALERMRVRLEETTTARRDLETRRRDHEQARAAAARRRAMARERHVRWEGQVAALAGGLTAAEAEYGRAVDQRDGIDQRQDAVDGDLSRLVDDRQTLEAAVQDAVVDLAAADAEVTRAQAAVDDLAVRERDLERQRSTHGARAEALRATVAEHGAGALAVLGASPEIGLDLLGRVADHVRVEETHGPAVAAVLGALGEAVVAAGPASAADAVTWLRDNRAGSATIVVVEQSTDGYGQSDEADGRTVIAAVTSACKGGARRVADSLHPAGSSHGQAVVSAISKAVADAVIVDDWRDAIAVQARHPALTVVTVAGDMVSPRGFVAASTGMRSSVLAATAADEADVLARGLADDLDGLVGRAEAAHRMLAQAREAQSAASDRRHRAAADAAAARERAARLADDAAAVQRQHQIVSSHLDEISAALDRDRSSLVDLRAAGPVQVELDDEVDTGGADLDEAVGAARERELDARVDVERTTEQVTALEGQVRELRREADEVEAALSQAADRRARRRDGIARCAILATVCATSLEALDAALHGAATQRDALSVRVRGQRDELADARARLEESETRLADAREMRHEAELVRADLDHRIAVIDDRLRVDFAMSVDDVLADHPDASTLVRDDLIEREDILVRKVGLLGRINPLALEEFKALEDRHAFLAGQVDDLRGSRRDLEQVIEAVDDRIRDVFTDAWEDISEAFEKTFAVVFPGGHGRLRLVGDEDPLTAGIEIEARPPGKKVTRLSLLSGGERSLTVLAFVFAIFIARPSPFYVLDEVDAALDDINLQRLLEVITSFRGSSQIIMVTHQKRSMEIADVLYGITMGNDAVTKVVAQRLDELTTAGVLRAAG